MVRKMICLLPKSWEQTHELPAAYSIVIPRWLGVRNTCHVLGGSQGVIAPVSADHLPCGIWLPHLLEAHYVGVAEHPMIQDLPFYVLVHLRQGGILSAHALSWREKSHPPLPSCLVSALDELDSDQFPRSPIHQKLCSPEVSNADVSNELEPV